MGETRTPTPRAYILGSELRGHRRSANLTTRALAQQLDIASHSVIIRWEKGDRVPSTEMVSAICTVIGLSGSERDRLVDMAREAADEPANSVSVGSDGEQDQLTALLEFERNATTITNVAPSLVPGLAQTSDYARAVMTAAPEAEKMVALRLGRREVITRRREPAEYRAFLLESVLHQQIGGRAVQIEQLRHLVQLAQLDNVEMRVVPLSAGWTPLHTGPFVLLEFARAAPVVHLEHHRSSVFLRDEDDVSSYQQARDDIAQVAMSADDTTKLIADTASRLENAR